MYYTVEELCARKEPGVFLNKLEPGTTIIAKTRNSTYSLVVTESPKKVMAEGGKNLPVKTEVIFTGSTWGGSCIKLDWVGIGMYMEMYINGDILKTTAVKSIEIIGPNNNWHFELS